ncbi:RNA ligase 1 isoform X5 [Hypanus sabinus]|uniref:RNA ligase 1 isoform X5 n=1 Tax=Hypanus sabinus TaxID=79690 RepID=UPI0028C47AC8|nr:RNA ligase 1 isoform X5 [Hypanus sabinus]
MPRLGTVQQKIPCAFTTELRQEAATKRPNQSYRVLANGELSPTALAANIHQAVATEKVDGTCCYVTNYKEFTWNIDSDFRAVPDAWIPAHGVAQSEGRPQPDENGHIPGWIPVEKGSKQYCWHLSAVNYETGSALVLRPSSGKQLLEITVIPLMELLEQTLELIGTHINGNPYGLGSKKQPLHLLVSHGSLQIENPPPLDLMDLVAWFKESEEAKVEGIVWHCANGVLVKLHRHHLGLEWPLLRPFLSTRPLSINVDLTKFTWDFEANSSFVALARLHGKQFDRVKDIAWEDIES